MADRSRVTIRGEGVELRGYVDETARLVALAEAMRPFGLVMASPIDDEYNPFQED